MILSPRLAPLDQPPGQNLIEVVEVSLGALAIELDLRHDELAPDGDKRLPSAWLASILCRHIDALRDALATYKNARLFEEDERLF